MGSFEISFLRDKYPGRPLDEIAATFARENGYLAVVGYKNSPEASDFTNIGAADRVDQLADYLLSPYCYDREILYLREDLKKYPWENLPSDVLEQIRETGHIDARLVSRFSVVNEHGQQFLERKERELSVNQSTEVPQIGTVPKVKKCPYCAEEIRYEAIVCRYCGRDLSGRVERQSRALQQAIAKYRAAGYELWHLSETEGKAQMSWTQKFNPAALLLLLFWPAFLLYIVELLVNRNKIAFLEVENDGSLREGGFCLERLERFRSRRQALIIVLVILMTLCFFMVLASSGNS